MTPNKIITINKKLTQLFNFLNNNNEYNYEFQNKFRLAILKPYKHQKERMFNLLHNTYYAQSKPDLDKAQLFFESLLNESRAMSSFKRFCLYLGYYDEHKPYLSLYNGLLNYDGWGPKTSALFVKNVYQIHYNPQLEAIRFWRKVPVLKEDDELFLPVDAVIKDIFIRLDKSLKDFNSINNYLQSNKKWKNCLLWDDLWFWGFINQKGSESPRELGFNRGKYWLQLHTMKDIRVIRQIEKLSGQFTKIIETRN